MSGHKQTETRYLNKCDEILGVMPAYVRSYIRFIHQRTSPRTKYGYLTDIQTFLKYVQDRKDCSEVSFEILSSLDKDFFEDYFEYLERYETDHGIVTNDRCSLARKLTTLRNFFQYLYSNNLISSFEISKLAQPKIPKKNIIKMDKEEASSFLSAVHGHASMTQKRREYYEIQSIRDLALVYLLLSSGIRVSECSELDIDDIDLFRSCIYITRKGGNEAVVYFSDEASAYLSDYIEWRNDLPDLPEDERALFISSRKQRLSVRSIEVIIKKYASSALPGKHITPHKLRATFATQLYEETGDIYLVAEALGHNDVATTKDRYANLSDKRKQSNRNVVTFDK